MRGRGKLSRTSKAPPAAGDGKIAFLREFCIMKEVTKPSEESRDLKGDSSGEKIRIQSDNDSDRHGNDDNPL